MLVLDIITMAEGGSSLSQGPASALTTWVPPTLMVIGVTILGFLLIHTIRHRRAMHAAAKHGHVPGNSAGLQPNASHPTTDHAEATRRQIRDAEARASDLLSNAEKLSTSLDQKSQQLEELLAAAQTRIAELTALVGSVKSESSSKISQANKSVSTANLHHAGGGDPLASAVYRLSDAGRKPTEIARELQEQVGKVELILALRRD